ncbi:MAG TPA: glycosyltransferase, partial [Abditibacterium sp.]
PTTMNIAYFTHSLRSDWNHGNAHFVRGVLTELQARGHSVRAFEPHTSWSAQNLVADAGTESLDAYRATYPTLTPTLYEADFDPKIALQDADLVIVHEWNPHDLVARIGQLRPNSGWKLLFHDTHHRAVSAPDEMALYDLSHYDGVLAFGQVISDLYRQMGWAKRAWTWHEAADTRVFQPLEAPKTGDLVWIGNWGDDERSRELGEFLIQPVGELGLKAQIFGVRYPDEAKAALREANINYGSYLPNFRAPQTFARHAVTVHVPRRPYVERLPGIPTIRPFEALACGIPLVSAPWNDVENLFRVGQDFLVARNGNEMKKQLRIVLNEPQLRENMIANGLETIRARHTCAHRVDELLSVVKELG